MGTIKSVGVTNLDAVPSKLNNSNQINGTMRVWADTVEIADGDLDDDDIVVMADLPPNAVIHSILVFNDDLDAHATPTLVCDFGIYNGAEDFTIAGSVTAAEAVIDRDYFATLDVSLRAAVTVGTELRYEGAPDPSEAHERLWELAGLAEDPKVNLRIAMTVETVVATAAAGTMSWIIKYSVT